MVKFSWNLNIVYQDAQIIGKAAFFADYDDVLSCDIVGERTNLIRVCTMVAYGYRCLMKKNSLKHLY